MPYITQQERGRLINDTPNTAGELNYVFTKIAIQYFEEHGGRYQQINDVLGAFEGAKLEFSRRIVAPYEDKKIKENGDISGYRDFQP